MKNIILDVPQILQCPELPNGCEITSLCQVLRYYGFNADKCELADEYLPRSDKWYGADPDIEYMGNPHLDDSSEESGYYCFPGAIITAAERYLSVYDNEKRFEAVDISGTAPEALVDFLEQGIPVVFWASLRFGDIAPDDSKGYDLLGGRRHALYHELHCMVLSGFDGENAIVTDPLDFNSKVPFNRFSAVYGQMERRALIVRKI